MSGRVSLVLSPDGWCCDGDCWTGQEVNIVHDPPHVYDCPGPNLQRLQRKAPRLRITTLSSANIVSIMQHLKWELQHEGLCRRSYSIVLPATYLEAAPAK